MLQSQAASPTAQRPKKLVAKKAGIAEGTVSNWRNLWYSYGIFVKEKNRYKKIISLKEIGVEIP